MDNYGFIITRHVISEKTNKYWNHCIKCLRTIYPTKKIVIIDDNSVQHFVKPDFDYKNIEVIQSEFKGRGELLPYYYYLKNKFFENAVIIHDSVFFHKRINFEKLNGVNVLPLWFFHPDRENLANTIRITQYLNNPYNIQKKISLDTVILGMKHLKWYGCFGVQSYINHNFLNYLQNKYSITNLIQSVRCRDDRCSLERIFGCLFFTESSSYIIDKKSILGDIMKYQTWGYSYEDYQKDIKRGKVPNAIIKIWSGR
jgi:hypothetical protein